MASFERKNQVLAIVCFGIGLMIRILTVFQVTAVSSSANTLSPAFFPEFVSYLLMICSVGLFVQSTIALRQGYSQEHYESRDKKKEGKVLVTFLMLIAYTALSNYIGFFLASEVFVAAFLLLMGDKRWWHYAVAAACVFIIYYCFRYLLFIHLPQLGIWII